MPRGIPKKKPDAQQQNGPGRTSGGRINKMDCVRQALGELGNDAQNKDIQDFLKRRFDLDMDTKMISTYKGTILKDAARKGGVTRPAATSPAPTPAPPKASRQVGAANGAIGMNDIRTVKELVGRIGVDGVRELAEVLSK